MRKMVTKVGNAVTPEAKRIRFAWLNIKDDIMMDINKGRYRPGDRIATVTQLAEKHGVSTTTVRQALDELAMEGVLEVRQGRGTVVAQPKREFDPTRGFEEQADQLGKDAQTFIYQTQWADKRYRNVVRYLKLVPQEKYWEVTRLHYIQQEPVMFDVCMFRRNLAERFMGDSNMLMTIFTSLRKHLGHDEWHVRVLSVNFTTERAFSDLLGIPRKTPFFQIEQLTSVGGKPLFASIAVLRGDKFQLTFV